VYYEKMALIVVADVSRCPMGHEELREELERFMGSLRGSYRMESFSKLELRCIVCLRKDPRAPDARIDLRIFLKTCRRSESSYDENTNWDEERPSAGRQGKIARRHARDDQHLALIGSR